MDDLLGLSVIAFTVIFAIWNAVSLYKYLSYRRVASSGELTWPPPKPWFYNMCLGMGFFMVSLTVILVFLHRPLLTVVAQALMALYYTVFFPLSFRFRRGLYSSGIWTEGGFVPYSRVRALNWREGPELILMVTTERWLTG